MKRSGPPARRTPLASGGPLPRQSQRRQGEAAQRAAVRDRVIARDRGCVAVQLVPWVTCAGPLDVDEVVPRSARPGGHLDPDNCQVLCRAHHDWKHAHPVDAWVLGLRRWSWEEASQRLDSPAAGPWRAEPGDQGCQGPTDAVGDPGGCDDPF